MSNDSLTFEKLKQLADLAPCGIGLFDIKTLEPVFLNKACYELTGYTGEEYRDAMTGRGAMPLMQDTGIGAELGRSGTANGFEFHIVRKDGEIRRLRTNATTVSLNGKSLAYCSFADITGERETRHATEAGAESVNSGHERSIIEDSAIGVFAADRRERKTLYLNRAIYKICGFPEDAEILGRPITDCLEAYGKKPLLSREQIASLRADAYTDLLVERDGRYYAMKARADIWNGEDAYIVYLSDETEEHEKQLQLQKLIDKVPTGNGIYDIEDGAVSLTYLNDAYFELLGIKRGERAQYGGTRSLEVIHQDDLPGVHKMIDSLINGANAGDVQHRILNGAGNWVWINLTASVVERRDGHLTVYVAFSDCDRLVRSQKATEEARIREKTLLASIPGGVAIYRLKKNGRLAADYVSEGLAKMCGYSSPEEFMEYLRDEAFAGTAEEDVPLIRAAAKKSLTDYQSFSVIYHIHVKDRPDVLARTDANLIPDCELGEDDVAVWYAVHTKVSEESKRILREKEHYRAVLDMLGVAYWEWSKENGYYASENYSKYAISRSSMDELRENRVLGDIVHPEDVQLLLDFFRQRERNNTKASATLRMLMTDGTYRWTEIFGFNEYAPNGERIRLSGTLRDVNDEWIEQRNRLQAALDAAQRANSAKSDFLSRMSHDMRTPMNGILGLAELSMDETDAGVLRDNIRRMKESGDYLLSLINDTLDFQKIESGKMTLDIQAVCAQDVLDGIVDIVRPAMKNKKLRFDVINAGIDLNWYILIDQIRFKQIFINLLSNAIKFTPEGGTVRFIFGNTGRNGMISRNYIRVSDTGVGMSEDFINNQLFKPFSQENSAISSQYAGSGLGLSIVKSLVELMGGRIEVASRLGVGTTFTVYLDYVRVEYADAKRKRDRENDRLCDSEKSLGGKRILLVEDHPLNREIAARLLAKTGCIVDCAENGQEGLEVFQNSEARYYDAILMDIRMPVLDGLAATGAIRALDREDARTVPIIAMTANAYEEDREKTKQAGMNGHLAKPIEPETLYKTLDTLIRGSGKGTNIEN